MDPNATLFEIRTMTAQVLAGKVEPDTAPAYLDELAEHVSSLDAWLARGGFLPSDWFTRGL